MVRIMNDITDKPDWENKVFNSDITEKWKAELRANTEDDITEKMIEWIIAELQYRSKHFKETGMVPAYDGGVIKSDSAIPESLKESLRAAVSRLENVPDHQKDYHPHSNNQVLDLVHPSLFPLVYGTTKIIKDGILGIDDGISKSGTGEVLPIPSDGETVIKGTNLFSYPGNTMGRPYSKKFQWLPCDVAFKSTSDSTEADSIPEKSNQCTITSYINNLHPREHKELYGILEQVISRAIPLWNMTLTPHKLYTNDYERIPYDEVKYDIDPDSLPEEDQPQQLPGEEDEAFWDRFDEWRSGIWRDGIILPEPGIFAPPEEVDLEEDIQEPLRRRKTLDLQRDYGKTGLQVIIKLANIHLTPENPEYGGGSWHVEGQLNEHICATALYYYDSANITESRLAFRQLEQVFGCHQDGTSIQYPGSVACKEGRLLTFSNIFQHRVEPFRLDDPTKPGHRKILALFLVDPNIRIISTANVPSQRADWGELVPWEGALGKLPRELYDEVVSYMSNPSMSMEDAKELRLELMEERKAIVADQDDAFASSTFSLCEH
ncbi:uncharacterized protein GIQ15_05755 [Arthroderma uncinatum]|uniref:uncharacterized protein n=1 Tax=Arthroderma uncinatum TaxID=74035 RepID=UPI00144AC48B|nr:uncharacterized protein GIQ15_05755 [Arthroderma uncinatum]KAF3480408.1 hypothetical protein GIQ15_05755 [Arthroderma uncinatum]